MFYILGVKVTSVLICNFLVYLMTGSLIFLVCRKLIEDFKASCVGMVAWLVWPIVMVRGLSGGVECVAAFALIFLLLISLFYLDAAASKATVKRPWLDLMFGITIGLTSQARLESPLLVGLCILPAILRARHITFLSALFSFFPFFIMKRNTKEFQGNVNASNYFGFEYFSTNFPDNLKWLLDFSGHQRFIQPAFFIFSIIGTVFYYYHAFISKRGKCVLTFPLVPISALIFYSFLLFLNFRYSGVVIRVPVVIFSICAIMVGVFFYFFSEVLGERKLWFQRVFGLSLTLAVLLGAPQLDADTLKANQPPRLEFEFLQTHQKLLPPKSVLFVSNGETSLSLGYSSFEYRQLQALESENHPWWQSLKNHAGEHLYYLKGWECFENPGDVKYLPYEKPLVSVCQAIEQKYELREVIRVSTGLAYDVILYQIKGIKSRPPDSQP
jgi:hypothetical protein